MSGTRGATASWFSSGIEGTTQIVATCRSRSMCALYVIYRLLVQTAGSTEGVEWEWRVDGVASHMYYFYAGAAPSPQHRPRSLLFADLSIAARRSLSIKRFQWPGVRRSEAFR